MISWLTIDIGWSHMYILLPTSYKRKTWHHFLESNIFITLYLLVYFLSPRMELIIYL